MLRRAIAFLSTRSQKQLGIRQQTGRLVHPTRTARGRQRQWIGGTNSDTPQRNIRLKRPTSSGGMVVRHVIAIRSIRPVLAGEKARPQMHQEKGSL